MSTDMNAAPRTVLVTGATQGLGLHIAMDLAARGTTVLLHGRDPVRLRDAAARVRALIPSGSGADVRCYLADLADLTEVRALAARIREAEPVLDSLVNNAVAGGGAEPLRREFSRQGYELRFAVNHLAPHLLIRELIPLLSSRPAGAPRPASAARVVNVASMGQSPVDFEDPMMEHGYEGLEAYCRSKLAMIMSTFELAAELSARTPGTGSAPGRAVTVNALHPAHLMDTRGVREYGLVPAVSIEEGVRPTVRLITDPALEGVSGRYFDRFTDTTAHRQAYDPDARRRLSELTARLTRTPDHISG